MVPSVPAPITAAVVAVAASVPIGGLLATLLGGREAALKDWWRVALTVAAGLVAWGGFGVGLALLKVGWGTPYRITALLEVLAYALPPFVVVAALRRAPRLRAALSTRAALWRMASVQIARSLGVVFLVLHASRKLPALFAYPAAWGDIAVAVSAPLAIWVALFRTPQLRRPRSGWRRAWIGWNLLGLADHVVAVTLGMILFPGVLQLVHTHPDTAMFAALPIVLFPIYLVPFACSLHLVMIDVVRHPAAATAEAAPEIAPVEGAGLAVGGGA